VEKVTADRIREVALFFFSQYGYKSTTLAMIAKEVGIKTPSVYAHFNSKQELFFSCLSYALENDLSFFQAYLTKQKEIPTEQVLYQLLVDYERWVSENPIPMFCLRMLYLPPHYFAEQLIQETNERIEKLRELLHPLFKKAKEEEELTIGVDEAIEAYLCLFDGLIIELLYTGSERFHSRLKASWQVFSVGLFSRPLCLN
jgi:AcrR family transcriptional regulator